MKDLLIKIKAVRSEAILGRDSRKTGTGGTWEYVSKPILMKELNPLMEKNNLDLFFDTGADEIGEYVELTLVDMDGDGIRTSKSYIKQSAKDGIMAQTAHEAQKSYLERAMTIRMFRLETLSISEAEYKRAMATESKEKEELLKKIDELSTPNQKKWISTKYDLDTEKVDTLKSIITLLESKNAKNK